MRAEWWCTVSNRPNTRELQHDFLWRHYLALPEKGKFSVFNRSHYENVLITRVNPQFLSHERHPQISETEEIDADILGKPV
jgi:polyphosphate kinase 2 (PPK2 family)